MQGQTTCNVFFLIKFKGKSLMNNVRTALSNIAAISRMWLSLYYLKIKLQN